MKKNIVALAVAAAISAPVAMADAPTVYGQLNLNIANDNSVTNNTGPVKSGMSVNSTASRLGVKGSEDLGNGLKAVYKVEFSLGSVADAGTTIGQRNAYLGLAGGFGTILMGRHDTPLKMSQPSDLFNDGAADLGNDRMTNGIAVGESRADDVLAYVSPSFSGVKIIAAAVMGEDTITATETATTSNDATSIAITYGSTKKGLYLAAAQTNGKSATAGATYNKSQTITRLSAQYKANGLTANVMQSSNSGDGLAATAKGTVTQANLGYKMGKFMPKVKVSMMDPSAAGAKSTTSVAYGLNYSLGKKTTAYIYAVDADKNNGTAGVPSTANLDSSYIGMVHNF
jgi:predicted porin